MSTQWNRQLSKYVSKVIKCLEQNIRKQIDCKRPSNTKQMSRLQKIFKLKYGNTKLLGNTKNNQVKLVLAVFFLRICANIESNYIKKTWYNQ